MTELWVAGGLAIGFILGRRFGSGRESVPSASPESPSRAAIRLLDTLEDGIVAVKADGILTLVNTAGQAMLGVSRDVTGRALVDLSLGNELVLARTGPVDSDDLSEMTLDDGRIVAIRVQIRDDGSRIYVLRDVTDIRLMDAMRRDFVANVSHELRTPVSVVRANAETLLEGALEDEAVARDFVSAITEMLSGSPTWSRTSWIWPGSRPEHSLLSGFRSTSSGVQSRRSGSYGRWRRARRLHCTTRCQPPLSASATRFPRADPHQLHRERREVRRKRLGACVLGHWTGAHRGHR